MDVDVHLLTQWGLVGEEQGIRSPPLRHCGVRIHNRVYRFHYSKGCYQLSSEQDRTYLVYMNGQLDHVPLQKNNSFEEASQFILVLDTISCAVFPKKHPKMMVCVVDSQMHVKKCVVCLQHNIVTIFEVVELQPPPTTKKAVRAPISKHTTPLASLAPLISHQSFDWLHIVASSPKDIPPHLQNRVHLHSLPSSIGYLLYIVQNYSELHGNILFLNETPIVKRNGNNQHAHTDVEPFIMEASRKRTYSYLDMRVMLDESVHRYGYGDEWGAWHTGKVTSTVIQQPIFWSHILKMAPPQAYLEVSSSNTRLVPAAIIQKYPLEFYTDILHRFKTSSQYSLEHLNRMWDTIFI
jgi:hypothetical protein